MATAGDHGPKSAWAPLVRTCTDRRVLTAKELASVALDALPETSTVVQVLPSVLQRHWAAVWAEPSMGLWRHVTAMEACVLGMTCEEDGEVTVGAAGAQMVTMPLLAVQALLSPPRALRTR